MAEGIPIREFARREGCSDTLVRKAIKACRLKALADGTLNPNLVGTGWRKANREGANHSEKGSQKGSQGSQGVPLVLQAVETPEQAAERIVTSTGATMTQAEAERVKENYLALLRQLEYDVKSGAVVPVVEVAQSVGSEYAKVRTRLLAIPAEQAPRLHRCKTVVEVQEALRSIITEALEELTRDGASGG
ncbi:hypothetical protein [Azospirillum cavernae]|uniref:hypothetical protein n=1 Tax=Azospirillum cavernae TaxID=2320860 RepID=UPI0011C3EA06|nr:hypothetical protein [Azospirillum cavernae]